MTRMKDYDFFISHSREKKETIAIPLCQALSALGFDVWMDKKGVLSGDDIYKEIEIAISKSIYCIAIIDSTFLSKEWTKREVELFIEREAVDKRTIILPIYADITMKAVIDIIPDLKDRAFESLLTEFDMNTDMNVLCRIISRYFEIFDIKSIEHIGNELLNYSFPCKDMLLALISSKQYYAKDMRLALLEVCNLVEIVCAIYENIARSKDKTIIICSKVSRMLCEKCFDVSFSITYDMYIAATNVALYAIDYLVKLLNI